MTLDRKSCQHLGKGFDLSIALIEHGAQGFFNLVSNETGWSGIGE